MRVNWPGGVGQLSPRRGPGTMAADAAFTLAKPVRDPAATRNSRPVGPAADLGAMLAVQAVDEPMERRRRAVRRGHSLLDRLEELRLGLLDGSVPVASLARLRMELAGGDLAAEPALRATLVAIELRAAVEIAKLECGRVVSGT